MENAAASTEMTMPAWSVVFLIVHIVVQTLAMTKNLGLGYLVTARRADAAVRH